MIETGVAAFATFFATIGPLDIPAVFAALTANATPRERRLMAIRGVLVGGVILLAFAMGGKVLLKTLGISLPALQIAGGILLLLMGIEMVFARSSGASSTTDEETLEATGKDDISVFPLATPLIAGPGAMGAAILLMAEASEDRLLQLAVLGGLFAVLLLTLAGLLLASQLQRWLGVTGMHVIGRVFGVLLAALAVQFMLDGLVRSGLLGA